MTGASRRAAITGVGVVHGAVTGGSAALGDFLAAPRSSVRRAGPAGAGGRWAAELPSDRLVGLVDEGEARRLSRVCQITVAAARAALADGGLDPRGRLALVLGSEFGDLRSTIEFADGYLRRGPAGLSPLLFPNTVMNTMAAAAAIAVQAREGSFTLNAPTIAGELAIARAAAAIAGGRSDAVLAGGVDQLDAEVQAVMVDLGAGNDIRGEGAAFLLLEPLESAAARGARVLGVILGCAWRALPARPCGVGRGTASRAIAAALEGAGLVPSDIGWMYVSASGDRPRDAWERRLLAAALGSEPPPATSLTALLGRHSGLGALRVAAAAWTARSGLLPCAGPLGPGGDPEIWLARVRPGPGLVHGVARGGSHVALVVGGGPSRS